MMEYTGDIYSLSAQFFADYPDSQYPEITRKQGRPLLG